MTGESSVIRPTMLLRRAHISSSLLLAAALVAGCKFEPGTLKRFSADIALWDSSLSSDEERWRTIPAEGWPVMTCVGQAAEVSDCCRLPASRPQVDCQKVASECDQDLNQCVLYFAYHETATIDLLKEVPSLGEQQDQIPKQVLLQSVTNSFASDFEWPLPALVVYVAPISAKDMTDPQAVYLATIPARSATTVLDDSAQRAFSDFAVDLSTPFKLLFATTVEILSGPAPQGHLAVHVTGRIEAEF